jgi:hypothetical protein
MATVYSAPSSIEVPSSDFKNINGYEKACEKYKADLKAMLQKRNKDKNVGEIIRFPVADSYAEYMVASMKPVELVHLPLWDAWNFQYAHLMTAKEVQGQIDNQKALEKLFKK